MHRRDSSKPHSLVYHDLISKSQESGTFLAGNSTCPLQCIYLLTKRLETRLRKALSRMTGAILTVTLKTAKVRSAWTPQSGEGACVPWGMVEEPRAWIPKVPSPRAKPLPGKSSHP